MGKTVQFIIKGILKSRYTFYLPLAIILFSVSLWTINYQSTDSVQTELKEIFDDRKDFLDTLIGKTLNKKRHVGLPENQEAALESLLIQEDYVKVISQKIADNDLYIAPDILAYIEEYELYKAYRVVDYHNEEQLEVEKRKAEDLAAHRLSFTEQETPYQTALFTKQLLHLLFNPLTALLYLLIFSYRYTSDRQNRIFDLLKLNSLANPAIYTGYVISFWLFMAGYLLFSVILAFLPPLVTGQMDTVFYPMEVVSGGETRMVPIWKWLLFVPLGWGLFVSLLLLVASWLCKQRVSLGVLAGFLTVPLLALYVVADQSGFSMGNPIHLVTGYETELLTSNRFVAYLAGMLLLLLVFVIISYPIFHSKWTIFQQKGRREAHKTYEPKRKWKIFWFEHLKKRRESRLLLTVLLLLGISIGTSIFVNQQYQNVEKNMVRAIEETQNHFLSIQVTNELLQEEHEVEYPTYENPYTEWVEDAKQSISVLDDLKKEAGSPAFLDLYRETMKSLNSFTSYKELEPRLWDMTVMASEEQLNLLRERGIHPWPIGDLWATRFDDPRKAFSYEHQRLLERLQEGNEKYGKSALFTAFSYMNRNVAWLVLGVFLFVTWASLAEEQRPARTLYFLVTKPLRLRSVYVSKWAYNLIAACLLFLFSGAVTFVVSWTLGGLGEADYPIPTYAVAENGNGKGQFFSPVDNVYFFFDSLLWMVLKCIALILAQIFFLNSLFSLIGRWAGNQYVVIVTTLIITAVGYLAASYYPAADMMMLNPFLYFDTWQVVDGWKSIITESALVNVWMGCLVLFTAGVVLFLAGLISKKGKVS